MDDRIQVKKSRWIKSNEIILPSTFYGNSLQFRLFLDDEKVESAGNNAEISTYLISSSAGNSFLLFLHHPHPICYFHFVLMITTYSAHFITLYEFMAYDFSIQVVHSLVKFHFKNEILNYLSRREWNLMKYSWTTASVDR